MLHRAHRVVTIRKSRPSGKRKSKPSHDTLENPQNTHNRPPQNPGKKKRIRGSNKRRSNPAIKEKPRARLFGGRRVLGNSLGTLRNGVLGKLTGEDQTNGGLNLSGRDGGLLVVSSQLGGLSGNALEDV